MLLRTVPVFLLGYALMVADAQIPAAGVLRPSGPEAVRSAQPANASSAALLQPSGGQDPAAGTHFKRVTIKQLRSDPKTFAGQKVAVRGQIGEVSRTEHYFELLQDNESLRVLLDSLPDSVQEKIYSAKPRSRVIASGEFSGYILFAHRVEIGK